MGRWKYRTAVHSRRVRRGPCPRHHRRTPGGPGRSAGHRQRSFAVHHRAARSVQPADLAGQRARVHFQQHLHSVGGVLSVDVILIGGGAGGAGGTASAFNGGPGGGGGGGGEVHVNIPATLLPKDGEDFASIEITIGAGGARGTVGNPGTGGGDTVFGSRSADRWWWSGRDDRHGDRAGCRWCRRCRDDPGGAGGSGRVSSGNGWPGGNSTSAYDLHGGGGGGGGGTDAGIGGPGGIGGISAGGTSGPPRPVTGIRHRRSWRPVPVVVPVAGRPTASWGRR